MESGKGPQRRIRRESVQRACCWRAKGALSGPCKRKSQFRVRQCREQGVKSKPQARCAPAYDEGTASGARQRQWPLPQQRAARPLPRLLTGNNESRRHPARSFCGGGTSSMESRRMRCAENRDAFHEALTPVLSGDRFRDAPHWSHPRPELAARRSRFLLCRRDAPALARGFRR